ncbi:MAG: hypothetical protein LC725_06915 [Lentisphaerae bacterium]|nr:hypothetical protein [Lentisphaerota bacterium]
MVFQAPGSSRFFGALNDWVLLLVGAAQAGQRFVFGSLGGDGSPAGFVLAFQAFPVIIFFRANGPAVLLADHALAGAPVCRGFYPSNARQWCRKPLCCQ